jgi:hypothetical protein
MENIITLIVSVGVVYLLFRIARNRGGDSVETAVSPASGTATHVAVSKHMSSDDASSETSGPDNSEYVTGATNDATAPEPKDEAQNVAPGVKETAELAGSLLKKLGCQPEFNEDGSIGVRYQGENFQFMFGNCFTRIWDPAWASINVNDKRLPNMREAMNKVNFNVGPTVVMTSPDKNGMIVIHSRKDLFLHPACPVNVDYMRAILDEFFEVKNALRDDYQVICAAQEEAQKNRRPVGFAAYKQEGGKEENSEEEKQS